MNASDDNELGIGHQNDPLQHVTLHYIQSWAGQFSFPKDLVIFPGQAVKIWDCPKQIGTDGRLTHVHGMHLTWLG